MKKKVIITTALLGTCILTGCETMHPLTTEENDMIAEYVAGLILNNEANYTEKLITPTPVPTPLPTATPVPTPVPTAEPEPTSGAVSDNKTPDETDEKDVNIQANADFSDIVGYDGIIIEYKSFDIQDEYSDGLFNINVEQGKKLLRVVFTLTNTTNDKMDISITDTGIMYQLDLGEQKFEKAMLTFIENDLVYLSTGLEAGDQIEVLLFFSVPEGTDIAGKNIIVFNKDKTAIIKLLE